VEWKKYIYLCSRFERGEVLRNGVWRSDRNWNIWCFL